jgi:hypothetical protein
MSSPTAQNVFLCRIEDAAVVRCCDAEAVNEVGPRVLRYRLVESIVPLAADGARLVQFAHSRDNSPVDDLVTDFLDWTYGFVPQLVSEGVLPPDFEPLMDGLAKAAVAALGAGPREEECEVAVFRTEWVELRALATDALRRFGELGVPVPELGPGLLGGVSTVPTSERD